MGTQDCTSPGDELDTSRHAACSDSDSIRIRTVSASSRPPHPQSSILGGGVPIPPVPRTPQTPPSIRLHSPPDVEQPAEDSSRPRPSSSGSPLKLFGNHDTYTSNKLLRRMSQFEAANASGADDASNLDAEREDMGPDGLPRLPSRTNISRSNHTTHLGTDNKQPRNLLQVPSSPRDKENSSPHQAYEKQQLPPLSKTEAKRSLKRSSKITVSKRRRTLQVLPGQDQVWDESILDSTGPFSTHSLVESMDGSQQRLPSYSRPAAPTPTSFRPITALSLIHI